MAADALELNDNLEGTPTWHNSSSGLKISLVTLGGQLFTLPNGY